MIRTILFRLSTESKWTEGVMHAFAGENAVVETAATGELNLVPVKPEYLKFGILMNDWLKMQAEAQQQARRQAVQAGPIPPDTRARV